MFLVAPRPLFRVVHPQGDGRNSPPVLNNELAVPLEPRAIPTRDWIVVWPFDTCLIEPKCKRKVKTKKITSCAISKEPLGKTMMQG